MWPHWSPYLTLSSLKMHYHLISIYSRILKKYHFLKWIVAYITGAKCYDKASLIAQHPRAYTKAGNLLLWKQREDMSVCYRIPSIKACHWRVSKIPIGTSLEVQWLRLWLWFLVRQLRSHMPCGQKHQNIKPKQHCNKFNKDIFINGAH